MSEEEKKEKGFQIKDRRRFTDDGQPREQKSPAEGPASEGPATDAAEKKTTGEARASAEQAEGRGSRGHSQFPEINFATFVMSLSSSVLIHLGLVPDPMSGETKRVPGMAKQTIDILGMLQEKTRGNLTDDERDLMDSLLYDLRLRYVEETKK